MRRNFLAPLASDSPEQVADWVELQAVFSQNRQFSLESLSRAINITGSTDALPSDIQEGAEDDADGLRAHRHPGEEARVVAESAFSEIESRAKACKGHRDGYPFAVEPGLLRLRGDPGQTDYEFFLLMSYSKPTAGHNGTAVLFEHLCGAAALGHLGGRRNGATAWRFGAPRKRPLAKLEQAINHLCATLGEGRGCYDPRAASHTGDGQLDIVAFRDFPDQRSGKLVLFGQCAAGVSGFEDKFSELDPHAFMKKWLVRPLLVDPLRLFFIPHRPPFGQWERTIADCGVLFDRCRITASIEQESFDDYRGAVLAANVRLMARLKKKVAA